MTEWHTVYVAIFAWGNQSGVGGYLNSQNNLQQTIMTCIFICLIYLSQTAIRQIS